MISTTTCHASSSLHSDVAAAATAVLQTHDAANDEQPVDRLDEGAAWDGMDGLRLRDRLIFFLSLQQKGVVWSTTQLRPVSRVELYVSIHLL